MDEQQLAVNIAKLRHRVRLSAEKTARSDRNILILAVSKTRPAEDIRLAHDCGLREFGESYLQEALQKMEQLGDLDLVWHFIGPIHTKHNNEVNTGLIASGLRSMLRIGHIQILRRKVTCS